MQIKKTKAISLFLIFFTIALIFTGCGNNRSAISSEQFCSIVESNGFTVADSKEQFAEFDYILNSYVALSGDNAFKIEFYNTVDEESARNIFEGNKADTEKLKTNGAVTTSKQINNYGKYRQSCDGQYWVLAYIDNTFLYAHTDKQYKDNVDEIFEMLGY